MANPCNSQSFDGPAWSTKLNTAYLPPSPYHSLDERDSSKLSGSGALNPPPGLKGEGGRKDKTGSFRKNAPGRVGCGTSNRVNLPEREISESRWGWRGLRGCLGDQIPLAWLHLLRSATHSLCALTGNEAEG
ncbi:hypothetical protein AVEN_64292-1 [Araneus ventricosus]|uniref:Uncharacterized protein n=1 Tax=Araneus ventricosus TaxID=182803 RepID=A0A4Y2GCJ8_ARAVE|nr:hypothetical protein AVEN_64292-1 [Araneus ventricosus]